MRRVLTGVVLVASALGLLAGGWALAQVFESPQQREAQASPPLPQAVTAEVTRGDLADTVAVNVEVVRATQLEVPLAGAGGRTVVTGRPVPDGADLAPLRPVVEVNGRPLILITGSFPMYRDLADGVEGSDVRQLQAALNAGGYPVGVDGRFGAGTAHALAHLYRDLGYPAAGTLPASEVVVVPQLPAQLVHAPALGAAADDTTALVASGGVVAAAELPDVIAQQLGTDTMVALRSPDGGELGVRVASVGETDAESGQARVTFAAADGDFPDALLGQRLLATITLELVDKDALLVPSVALTPRGTGDPVVVRVDADGTAVEVRVRELGALAGTSAVEPVEDGELEPGDQVRVG